jgi:hypothetical protein
MLERAVASHAARILGETLAVTAEDQLLVSKLPPELGEAVELDLEGTGKGLLALAQAAPEG